MACNFVNFWRGANLSRNLNGAKIRRTKIQLSNLVNNELSKYHCRLPRAVRVTTFYSKTLKIKKKCFIFVVGAVASTVPIIVELSRPANKTVLVCMLTFTGLILVRN